MGLLIDQSDALSRWAARGLPQASAQDSTQHKSYSHLVREWHILVRAYIGTRLTYESDKLAAVAGLAQYVSAWKQDEYLAGLWSSSLAVDLLWVNGGKLLLNWTHRGRVKHRKKSLFPTWSWASSASHQLWWQLDERIRYASTASLIDRVPLPPEASDKPVHQPSNWLSLRGIVVPISRRILWPTLSSTHVEFHMDTRVDDGEARFSSEAPFFSVFVCFILTTSAITPSGS